MTYTTKYYTILAALFVIGVVIVGSIGYAASGRISASADQAVHQVIVGEIEGAFWGAAEKICE